MAADYSKRDDHPKVQHGGRVIDFLSGEHFDSILQDTPDQYRPPGTQKCATLTKADLHSTTGVILFWGHRTCSRALEEIPWVKFAESVFPSRARLMVGMYNVDAAPEHAWYKFSPEQDLRQRFGVSLCPSVIFIPRSCNGMTDW